MKQETGNRKQETGNRKQETGNRKITSDAFVALAISAISPVTGAKYIHAVSFARSTLLAALSRSVPPEIHERNIQNRGPPVFGFGDVEINCVRHAKGNSNGKEFKMNRRRIFQTAIVALAALAVCSVSSAGPGSNYEHEIMIYSIENYGILDDILVPGTQDIPWKPTIDVSNSQNPAVDFWDRIYTNCLWGDSCAYTYSYARKDSLVTVDRMCNDGGNDFNDADMVIFHGHNSHLTGSYSHSLDGWRPFWLGTNWEWYQDEIADVMYWGTSSDTYYYSWPEMITNASSSNPYAVFYAHNPITSILIGNDYIDGNWTTHNTPTSSGETHSGRLGTPDGEVEWFIANGCNAVPVARSDANQTDVWSDPRGKNIWSKVWYRMHLVMGHYYGAYTSQLINFYTFAYRMKAGYPLKDAYFDLHNSDDLAMGQPSAISAVSRDECCVWQEFSQTWYCGPSCVTKYMTQDEWDAPLPDPTGTLVYTVSWNEGV